MPIAKTVCRTPKDLRGSTLLSPPQQQLRRLFAKRCTEIAAEAPTVDCITTIVEIGAP